MTFARRFVAVVTFLLTIALASGSALADPPLGPSQTVTDGSTTLSNTHKIQFTSGCTQTNSGSTAQLACTGTGVPTTRAINTTSPLTGGGTLATDLTLACATCLVQGSNALTLALSLADTSGGLGSLFVIRNNGSTVNYVDINDNSTIALKSGVTDSGTAVAFALDSVNALSTSGDKLLSLRSATTERWFFGQTANGFVLIPASNTFPLKFYTHDGFGFVSLDDNNGPRLGYSSTTITGTSAGLAVVGGAAAGTTTTFAANLANLNTISATGVSVVRVNGGSTNGSLYFGTVSGSNSIYGESEDLTADAGGTTAATVVCWSGAQKVATCGTSINLTTIAGVTVLGVAAASQSRVMRRGRVFVNCDAGITSGQLVGTSGTVGGNVSSVTTSGSAPSAGSIVGRATENCGATTAGQILIDLILG